jgi:hypothetical protein
VPVFLPLSRRRSAWGPRPVDALDWRALSAAYGEGFVIQKREADLTWGLSCGTILALTVEDKAYYTEEEKSRPTSSVPWMPAFPAQHEPISAA